MNISQFSKNYPGRLVPVSGIPSITHAFLPDPLPPQWLWPDKLYNLLIEAHKSLSKLDGIGSHLPNPQLIIRPLQNREAQISSKLEGTITEPEQQVLFQIEPSYPESENDPRNAQREVFNYGRALRYRQEAGSILPLSLRLIKKLHLILMDGVRGSEQDPGNFRRVQNMVGSPPHYVPPPINYIEGCLDNLEKYLHKSSPFDSLVNVFIIHYQFEAIHPFRDGNGRVGRLLLAILIKEWCGLSNQWLYMSSFFHKNKDEYIDRLLRVSTHGDWEGWVEFCLRGVVEQATDTEERCERLINLRDEYKERIERVGGSHRLHTIVDELFLLPADTIPRIAKRCDVTYPTAKSDVERLIEVDVIREIGSNRPRVFYAPEILTITYED
jgi:Fic family protein